MLVWHFNINKIYRMSHYVSCCVHWWTLHFCFVTLINHEKMWSSVFITYVFTNSSFHQLFIFISSNLYNIWTIHLTNLPSTTSYSSPIDGVVYTRERVAKNTSSIILCILSKWKQRKYSKSSTIFHYKNQRRIFICWMKVFFIKSFGVFNWI